MLATPNFPAPQFPSAYQPSAPCCHGSGLSLSTGAGEPNNVPLETELESSVFEFGLNGFITKLNLLKMLQHGGGATLRQTS